MKNKIFNCVFIRSKGKLLFLLFLFVLSAEINAQGNKWKWICYGDTRTNDSAHRDVLQSMIKNSSDYKFVINVGDVIEDGRVPQLWETWKKSTDEILGGTGQTSVPPKYLATPGNHDEVMTTGLANWNKYLPGQFKLYGNEGKYFTFDYENARFVIMNTEEPYTSAQKKMLLDAIENNPKTWLFVIWHKPIFSFGGKPYESIINTEWGAPLYKNGCDAIFNGHAHIYLRTKKLKLNGQKYPEFDPVNGVANIITGNSGAPIEPISQNRDGNAYMIDYAYDVNQPKFYGYTELSVDGETMYLKHISSDGKVMDQATYKANFKRSHLPRFRVNRTIQGNGTILVSPPDSIYDKGTEVTLTAQGDLGWKFGKWTGDLSGTVNPVKVILDTNKNVTAQFVEAPQGQYELRAETAGLGKIILDPPGPYYAAGTTVTVRAVPDSASKFDKWENDTYGSATSLTVTMNSHIRIKALFSLIKTYGLQLRKPEHGSVSFGPAGDKFFENTSIKITAVPETGWEFMEWTGDKNGKANPDTVIMRGDKEIKAIFRKTGSTISILKPVEDTYVRGGLMYATRNFDPDTCLRVLEGTSDIYRARSYLKFDLKAIKGDILSAHLKVKVKSDGLPDGTPATANLLMVENDSWKESLMTWKSAAQAEDEMDSYLTINQPELYYSWDATYMVQEQAQADSMVGFMIWDGEGQNRIVDFYSRETAASPELVIETGKTSGIAGEEKRIPQQYSLEQNYPNPFNPSTEIIYSLTKPGNVKLKIYDIMGKEVVTLVDGFRAAGNYKTKWNAKDNKGIAMASGIYICTIETPGFSKAIKMMLLQ